VLFSTSSLPSIAINGLMDSLTFSEDVSFRIASWTSLSFSAFPPYTN